MGRWLFFFKENEVVREVRDRLVFILYKVAINQQIESNHKILFL